MLLLGRGQGAQVDLDALAGRGRRERARCARPARVAATAWSNGACPVAARMTHVGAAAVRERAHLGRHVARGVEHRPTRRACARARGGRGSGRTRRPSAPFHAAELHQQRARSGPGRPPAPSRPARHLRLRDRLQAGVHRLDERGLLGEHAVGHAGSRRAPRSTASRRHVLGEAAARRLEAGGGAVPLVGLALRVGADARSRSRRGTGCGGARRRASPSRKRRHARADARHACRRSRGRRRAAAASRPFSIFLRSVPQTPQASTRTSISPGADLGHRHVLDPQVARTAVDGGLQRLAADQALQHEEDVLLALAQPAGEVREPVRAVGHVDADVVARRHQLVPAPRAAGRRASGTRSAPARSSPARA